MIEYTVPGASLHGKAELACACFDINSSRCLESRHWRRPACLVNTCLHYLHCHRPHVREQPTCRTSLVILGGRSSIFTKMERICITSKEIFSLNKAFCPSCIWRFTLRNKPLSVLPAHPRRALSNSHHLRRADTARATTTHDVQDQAYPLKGYYQILKTPTRAPRSAPESTNGDEQQSSADKLSIVFGTRLAGPGYSSTRYHPSATPETTWKRINGVAVPPRPEEPDNCCMSGCVHCVWDDYRDDVEEWAVRVQEAQNRRPHKKKGTPQTLLGENKRQQGAATRREVASASMSMDDDGGGSETNWDFGPGGQGVSDDLFSNIPVGIREFMKTEKRLKEKHSRDRDHA